MWHWTAFAILAMFSFQSTGRLGEPKTKLVLSSGHSLSNGWCCLDWKIRVYQTLPCICAPMFRLNFNNWIIWYFHQLRTRAYSTAVIRGAWPIASGDQFNQFIKDLKIHVHLANIVNKLLELEEGISKTPSQNLIIITKYCQITQIHWRRKTFKISYKICEEKQL